MSTTREPITDHNWYNDRYQRVLVQRKLLTAVTLLSLVCTLVTVVVISQLAPLKTVEPFVIQVDQRSGITQVVDPTTVKDLTASEAINNFFIVQYVRARESYHISDLAYNYNLVRVMSESGTVYPAFVAQANPNNPQSNAARLGSTGTRSVKFESITYLKPQLAQVRLLIEEKSDNSGYTQQHMIATIEFQYIKMNLTTEERYINPLGFRIIGYRLDEETLAK
ncbi:MAG: hypothetical protein KGI29_10570 [Pseudomonadota bacterium]|nr:hypothetical protein [Pseudomonadota bacterium]MDE3037449.1 hypothetical protein [Pseudomonadota bacterium]